MDLPILVQKVHTVVRHEGGHLMRVDAEQRERLARDDVQVAGQARDRRATHKAARVMPPLLRAAAAAHWRARCARDQVWVAQIVKLR